VVDVRAEQRREVVLGGDRSSSEGQRGGRHCGNHEVLFPVFHWIHLLLVVTIKGQLQGQLDTGTVTG
jgi:hypothetical protein